jgi:hypothetical protein
MSIYYFLAGFICGISVTVAVALIFLLIDINIES